MSLDITLSKMSYVEVYSANITHNLTDMADEAGIYKALWRPEELGITRAEQLILPLTAAIGLMYQDPQRFIKHNALNEWGVYGDFLPWLEKLLKACEKHPDANISVWR